jgi:hypothetical protein
LVRTTRKGRFWPYLGDRNHAAAVFDYTPTRERAGPEMFLKHYRGYLQADAYVAYDSFFTNPARGLVEVACWAHTRRHFHQALDTDAARMGAVLAYIAQLYAVEKRARRSGVEGDQLRSLREQASRPVLTELHEYLLKIRDQVLPKSEAGPWPCCEASSRPRSRGFKTSSHESERTPSSNSTNCCRSAGPPPGKPTSSSPFTRPARRWCSCDAYNPGAEGGRFQPDEKGMHRVLCYSSSTAR